MCLDVTQELAKRQGWGVRSRAPVTDSGTLFKIVSKR